MFLALPLYYSCFWPFPAAAAAAAFEYLSLSVYTSEVEIVSDENSGT
jgi:hypothetical protein